MHSNKRRFVEKERITHISVIAPTTRLLVIAADVWQGDDGKTESESLVMPVLSIRNVVIEIWSRRERGDESDFREYANADDLSKAGYQFQRQQLVEEMLVVHPENGDALTTLDDLRSEGFAVRVVTATWEPCEDEQRLAPIVASLVADVTKQLSQQQPIGGKLAS